MKRDVKLHHEARHNGEKHICEDCGLEYLTRFTLQKHKIAKHSGIILQCDQCDYKMDGQQGTMKTHKRRMHGDSKFLCIHCPYIANKKDDMEKHKETLHGDEIEPKSSVAKNHEQKRREREKTMDLGCKECGKKYKARNGLRFHMNSVHRGITFPCPETGCEYKAKLKHSLVIHTESKHIKVRYNCDICNLSYGNTDALQDHRARTHQIAVSVYPCDKCGMRSKDPEKTRKHMLTMHN
jgi:KRAB domain-containing zinc finger protein